MIKNINLVAGVTAKEAALYFRNADNLNGGKGQNFLHRNKEVRINVCWSNYAELFQRVTGEGNRTEIKKVHKSARIQNLHGRFSQDQGQIWGELILKKLDSNVFGSMTSWKFSKLCQNQKYISTQKSSQMLSKYRIFKHVRLTHK